MATKAKSKTKTKKVEIDMQALQTIVNAGDAGMYAPESVYAPLAEAGMVEVNTAMEDDSGNHAVRATEKGKKTIAEQNCDKIEMQTETLKGKTMIQVEKNVPIPAIVGRGRGAASVYPFDEMEVNDSFFVPNTEDRPNAAKSLASTVGSANARYAEADPSGATRVNRKGNTVPVTVQTRKFVMRSVEGGARIWRVL